MLAHSALLKKDIAEAERGSRWGRTEQMDFSVEGCQIIAGGRSGAKTTGQELAFARTLEGCQSLSDTPPGC